MMVPGMRESPRIPQKSNDSRGLQQNYLAQAGLRTKLHGMTREGLPNSTQIPLEELR
jgi:hypothetical protein